MKTVQTIVTTVGESLQDIIDALNIHIKNLEVDNEYDKENMENRDIEYIYQTKEDKIKISQRNKIIKNTKKIIKDIEVIIKKAKNTAYNSYVDKDKLKDVQVCYEICHDTKENS
jgi:hypothetical protein